jgi:hypothetical protein
MQGCDNRSAVSGKLLELPSNGVGVDFGPTSKVRTN